MNWTEALIQWSLFAGKTLVVLAVIALILALVGSLIASVAAHKAQSKFQLKVDVLNEKMEHFRDLLRDHLWDKEELKVFHKTQKKESKKDKPKKPKLFVLEYAGDIKAHGHKALTEEINAILDFAEPKKDEVLLRIESPGGVVHGYGYLAAQVARVRDRGLQLTVSVDKVAASGGYLMAVPAHRIIASPFAIVGSIGVLAQVPNFHRLLKKVDVDYKEYIAGDYKRTVSLLGEITPKGEAKFQEQLEQTHHIFKDYVGKFRPQLDLSQVTTGEYWYGSQALGLGLIDEVLSGPEYLLNKMKDFEVVQLTYEEKKPWNEKLGLSLASALEKSFFRLLSTLEEKSFPRS